MDTNSVNLDTTTDEIAFTGAVNKDKVVLYSTPNCMGCRATEREFKKLGMVEGTDYVKVDLSQDEEAYAMVKAKGFTAAPVVFAGEQSWSGFDRDRIKALVSA